MQNTPESWIKRGALALPMVNFISWTISWVCDKKSVLCAEIDMPARLFYVISVCFFNSL